jgi:protein disulfide-isomerase A1
MNFRRVLGLLTLATLLASAAAADRWGAPEENDVVNLTDTNFDDFLATHEWVFVKYYAPWCGHCKTMAPGYSELALEHKYKENGIPIAKVDATVAKRVAEKMKPQGFPTLRLYNRGFEIDYKGGRDKKDIEAFIEAKMTAQAIQIDTEDEFEELKGAHLAAIYFLDSRDSSDIAAFKRFILQFDKVPFAYTHNPKIQKMMGGKGAATFYIVRNFDEGDKLVDKDRPFKDSELAAEFKKVRFGHVMEFNDEVMTRIDEEKKTTLYVFTADKRGPTAQIIHALAPKYSKDFFFVMVDAADEKIKRIAEYFGIRGNEAVRLMGYKGGKNQKFKVNELTESAITGLLDDFLAGKARQYLKTDPIPATNDAPIKNIVGANFGEMIIKSNKHVLLEIYAPWCGHCKQMEPMYNELAIQLSGYDDILIAKMDGTGNEYPKVEATGYPTILLFLKGKKDKPVKFEGEKTLQKFLIFLNRHIGRVHKTATPSNEL